jgi:hypothetical protein
VNYCTSNFRFGKSLIVVMPMNGLRRNDDATGNRGWYQKKKSSQNVNSSSILYQVSVSYFTTTESFKSASTKIRPQFSQTIIFLRNLISLCF